MPPASWTPLEYGSRNGSESYAYYRRFIVENVAAAYSGGFCCSLRDVCLSCKGIYRVYVLKNSVCILRFWGTPALIFHYARMQDTLLVEQVAAMCPFERTYTRNTGNEYYTKLPVQARQDGSELISHLTKLHTLGNLKRMYHNFCRMKKACF